MNKEMLGDSWTASHDKELDFNKTKQKHRMFEAVRANLLKPEELTCEFLQAAVGHFANVEKNMVTRERAEARTKRVCARELPTEEELSNLRVWIADGLQARRLDDAVGDLQLTRSAAEDAQILVVPDPADITNELVLAAAVNGAWIMTADMLTQRTGVCLKVKDALRVKRKIFMTAPFKADNPSIAALVEAKSGHTWKLLDTITDFATQKHIATKAKNSSSVMSFLTDIEKPVFTGVQHCFNLNEMLCFLFQLDTEKSSQGIFTG
jgi:hypothetical protein